MGAVAAIIIRKEKDRVTHFRRAGAVSAASAQSLAALEVDEGVAFRKLRDRAVIREAAHGFFYLDEPSWLVLGRLRRRRLTLVLLIVVTLAIAGRTGASP